MRFFGLACGLAVLGFVACGGSDFSSNSSGSGGSGTGGSGTGGSGTGGTGTGGATTPASWCGDHKGTALFCDDFDSYASVDAVLNGGWSNFTQINGAFSFTSGVSVPNAFRVRTSATQGVDSIVVKTFNLTAPPSKIRLEFALNIKEASGMGTFLTGAAIAAIILGTDISADGTVALEIGNGSNLYTVWYKSPPDGGNWLSQIGSQDLGALPTTNQWAGRFAMEIQYNTLADAARTACIQMYVGGLAKGTCAPLSAGMEVPPTTFTVALGVHSIAGTTGTIEVLYDNVLVTTGG